MPAFPLPRAFRLTCRRLGVRLTRHILLVWVDCHCVEWLEHGRSTDDYRLRRRMLASTSRFGLGQIEGSHCTPLGLHRVAQIIGTGWPEGTVFQGRVPTGLIWAGLPSAPIAHRILWLEGLQPGFNAGGNVDSFRRFIYIHGVGDELTLGKPASRGCVHLAARHILELASVLPAHSLVWITRGALAAARTEVSCAWRQIT